MYVWTREVYVYMLLNRLERLRRARNFISFLPPAPSFYCVFAPARATIVLSM